MTKASEKYLKKKIDEYGDIPFDGCTHVVSTYARLREIELLMDCYHSRFIEKEINEYHQLKTDLGLND